MQLLLFMSLRGGILVLCILCFRILLRNVLTRRIFVYLWVVAACSFFLPFSFPVKVVQGIPRFKIKQIFPENGNGLKQLNEPADISDTAKEGLYSVILPDIRKKEKLFFVWTKIREVIFDWRGIYSIGIIISIAYLFLPGRKENRIFREALPVTHTQREQVFEYISKLKNEKLSFACYGFRADGSVIVPMLVSDWVISPVSIGIFRPKIILTKTLSGEEQFQLMYILLHEVVHIRQHDNLLRLICAFAVIAQWFNPLSWVMFYFVRKDIELACDETVVTLIGNENRVFYANALIDAAKTCRHASELYCSFSKNGYHLKGRITDIMNNKKKKKWSSAIGSCILLLSLMVFWVGLEDGRPALADVEMAKTVEILSETEEDQTEEVNDNTWILKKYYNMEGDLIVLQEQETDVSRGVLIEKVSAPRGEPQGSISKINLDDLGRKTKGEIYQSNGLPTGTAIAYEYDSKDQLSKVSFVSQDPDNNINYYYEYDENNNVSCRRIETGGGIEEENIVNEYNENKQLVKSITRRTGRTSEVEGREGADSTFVSEYIYDEQGRMIQENLFDDTGKQYGYYEYVYDP